jgi:hypothetical protein
MSDAMNPADAVLLALEPLVQAGVVIAVVESGSGSGSGSLPEVVVVVADPDPQARLPEIKALVHRAGLGNQIALSVMSEPNARA